MREMQNRVAVRPGIVFTPQATNPIPLGSVGMWFNGTTVFDVAANGSQVAVGGVTAVYTDGTRPAASGFAAGYQIFNTSDASPNWSDGNDWRDAVGSIT